MSAIKLRERLLPFLRWLPLQRSTVRADIIAGATVAMILIPQSMAYAQLAGLPAYYGLYAAFLPVIIGAMWGSSHQLATGPVAMVSLLTGSALAQFAAPGSEQFIALAILLALLVGIIELAMGLFRLGAIVNFLSHPVIVGFTNAAAIIIALSQFNKLLGVHSARSDRFLGDVWDVLLRIGDTHLPTLAMGLLTLAVIILTKRYRPAWPGVLIAVALTTTLSWGIDFERNTTASPPDFRDPHVRNVVDSLVALADRSRVLREATTEKAEEITGLAASNGIDHPRLIMLNADLEFLKLELRAVEAEHRVRFSELRRLRFTGVRGAEGGSAYSLVSTVEPGTTTDGRRWIVARIDGARVRLTGGGEVVGQVPAGIPQPAMPGVEWETMIKLLPTALIIALIGFMEAISIAKSMATQTKQRISPDQELIGQGLANIVGSAFQSFAVSGSFSRSAVNLATGAVSGLSSVVAGVIVLVTLLLFTPLLYHMPQAALAAIIMLAVAGLVNFKAMVHAWQAHRHDGIAATVTFLATLSFAPHLDTGILVGAALAIILYLYRTMRPRVAVLGRHPDGTMRDAHMFNLPTSERLIAIRFDGSLFFANVPYFEDVILEQAAQHPQARYILVVGDAINELDASGEEMIRHLARRLQQNDVTMVFSGLKRQVLGVMEKTGLYAAIGAQNFFRTEDAALEAISQWLNDPAFDEKFFPLRRNGNNAASAASPDAAPALPAPPA
ncbi:MAG: STAS domain-containing protein [Burkholderiales bacterium]|jgi:SulP family sulfate permease|nr:STAS domain-containing protein [Burkholderiales bacterium]